MNYTAHLVDCNAQSADKVEATELFEIALNAALGGYENVALAYLAYSAALKNDDDSSENLAAIALWQDAVVVAERAAFSGWDLYRNGSEHFEIWI